MGRDRIEKSALLSYPREQVWRAVSDSTQFGCWFGAKFSAPFAAGEPIEGIIAPTQVDAAVAKLQEPHAGKAFRLCIDQIDPPCRFSFRWHPFAIDESRDYSAEPMTRVTFDLADAGEAGTRLTIVGSGFDQLPAARRASALEANDGGWTHQLKLIGKFLQQIR